MVLLEEIQVIRWGGVTLVGYWLMAHFQTGFYIDGSGQKEREYLFLKLSKSFNTEGTLLYVLKT